ncbi:MAG: 16S rRNA (uracil(1498)-N(3))-methyltransferase [Deltaproteobacteria bacterium]|nr:16S rRNA (uracil(1498)-N(3))-methyltransferase [Deltaproteobacteria bacterium]
MPQFLVDSKNIVQDKLHLSVSESHHLLRVLRKSVGDEITISDGECKQYYCVLQEADLEFPKAILKILKVHQAMSPKPRIHLVCAVLKNQRMDWLIEKATELGVDEITPLLSQHGVVELKSEKDKTKKQERFIALSQAALKQSQNLHLPQINEVLSFQEYLKKIEADNPKILQALLHPYNSLALSELETDFSKDQAEECLLLIGPEGGFSEVEVKMAHSKGFKSYSLGKNILRGETAGIYALSLLSFWRTKRSS